MNFINDNIYGAIKLQGKEKEIVDLPIFQRLRGIQQQGLAYLVFPSAVHTRFSHSLGVLHIISKYCDHLKSEYGGQSLCESEIEVLRLSALLHDIGHYPFSHLGEWVYRCKPCGGMSLAKEVGGVENPLESPSPLCWIGEREKINREAHHEEVGATLISSRPDLCRIISDKSINRSICNIIRGSETDMVSRSLLHSSLDSDRLDYLLRDSAALGVKYGLIDYEYLIHSSRVSGQVSNVGKNLTYKEKSVPAIEHYLMSRYFATTQVIFHRTVQAYEDLLKLILWTLSEKGYIFKNYEEIRNNINKDDLIYFDDRDVMNKIYKAREDEDDLKFYIDALRNRHKIEFLFDFRCADNHCIEKRDCFRNRLFNLWAKDREKIIELSGIKAHLFGFFHNKVEIDYSRDKIKEENEKAMAEAPRIECRSGCVKYFNEMSGSVVKHMLDKELDMFRIYFINDGERHNLSQIRDKIKKEVGGDECE
jgi:hypothetical protein